MANAPTIIRREALQGEAAAWKVPQVDPASRLNPQEELQRLREAAKQQGFEAGQVEGMKVAQQQFANQLAALETVFAALTDPMDSLDHEFENAVLAVIQVIAERVVKRELQLDREPIVAEIRTGLAALPMASNDIVVRLHPTDANLISAQLEQIDADRRWRIAADATVQPGDCLIETASSRIDCRVATQVRRIIDALPVDAIPAKGNDADE